MENNTRSASSFIMRHQSCTAIIISHIISKHFFPHLVHNWVTECEEDDHVQEPGEDWSCWSHQDRRDCELIRNTSYWVTFSLNWNVNVDDFHADLGMCRNSVHLQTMPQQTCQCDIFQKSFQKIFTAFLQTPISSSFSPFLHSIPYSPNISTRLHLQPFNIKISWDAQGFNHSTWKWGSTSINTSINQWSNYWLTSSSVIFTKVECLNNSEHGLILTYHSDL